MPVKWIKTRNVDRFEKEISVKEFKGTGILIEDYEIVKWGESLERDGGLNLYDLKSPDTSYSTHEPYGKIDRDRFIRNENEEMIGHCVIINSNLKCSKDYVGVFDFISNVPAKLWVNGKCIMIHQYGFLQGHHSTADLHEGNNEIIIALEIRQYNSKFTLRLTDYDFEMSRELSAKTATNPSTFFDPAILISDYFYQDKADEFTFMIFKNNNIEYESEYKISGYDSESGQALMDLPDRGLLNEKIVLKLDKWRKLSDKTYRFERIDCILHQVGGQELNLGFCLLLNDFKQEEKLCSIQDVDKYPDIILHYILGMYGLRDFYESVNDMNLMFWNSMWVKEFIEKYQLGGINEKYYEEEGIHQVFIKSRLDGGYVKLQLKMPRDYNNHLNANRKYPLFMTIAFSNEGDNSNAINTSALDEDIVHVDVTGRAFTGGSYVGEGSILEIFEWIKGNLRIDENRVYLMGQSSGAYGVWAMAQNYPHLFAGIFPVSGLPHEKMISNVYNIPTYYFASEQDFIMDKDINKVKKLFENTENYIQEDIPNITHGQLCYYSAQSKIMNLLLKKERVIFPRHIRFTTCRNRHNRSYYIKEIVIEEDKEYGSIEIWSNEDEILIKSSDIVSFQIDIPDFVKNGFKMYLDDMILDNLNAKRLIFVKEDGSWKIVDDVINDNILKGTGLLDIYRDVLNIVIDNEPSELELDIAYKFAHPQTNAVDPTIFVNYPIVREINDDANIESNKVIICNVDSNLARKYMKYMKTVCDTEGYRTTNRTYKGPYCVMEAVNDRKTSNKTILLLVYNSNKMLKRNLLLRRITIPTYYNGIHPFWNSQLLCFDNDGYWSDQDNKGRVHQQK